MQNQFNVSEQNNNTVEEIFKVLHTKPTVRIAVSATSLLMRPSTRDLRVRLTNHMQGTQNLL